MVPNPSVPTHIRPSVPRLFHSEKALPHSQKHTTALRQNTKEFTPSYTVRRAYCIFFWTLVGTLAQKKLPASTIPRGSLGRHQIRPSLDRLRVHSPLRLVASPSLRRQIPRHPHVACFVQSSCNLHDAAYASSSGRIPPYSSHSPYPNPNIHLTLISYHTQIFHIASSHRRLIYIQALISLLSFSLIASGSYRAE